MRDSAVRGPLEQQSGLGRFTVLENPISRPGSGQELANRAESEHRLFPTWVSRHFGEVGEQSGKELVRAADEAAGVRKEIVVAHLFEGVARLGALRFNALGTRQAKSAARFSFSHSESDG